MARHREIRDGNGKSLGCAEIMRYINHCCKISLMAHKTAQEILDLIGEEAIFDAIADCCTLQAIADCATVSKTTLITWLTQYPDQYARAREAQADKMAEDILQIADDGARDTYVDSEGVERTDQDVIARSRLRVEARKWLAGKMAPKRYGDKVEATLQGPDGGAIQMQHKFIMSADDLVKKIRGGK